ncbi:hypothetical protein LSTR_LSTR006163 [Laodelphax striatellus]|uniref:Uncharacterized protein n=1 Tax=Laodelphax striatellus TaxID=195883 RepID=A0A482XQY1_LAOST|nr:hypothetical protein LSTR_LSTR006163 [Laodelphax striatellus]
MERLPDRDISAVLEELWAKVQYISTFFLCSSDEDDIFDFYDSDADPVYQPNLEEETSESDEETHESIIQFVADEENGTIQDPAGGDTVVLHSLWGPVGAVNPNNFVFNPSNEPCGVNYKTIYIYFRSKSDIILSPVVKVTGGFQELPQQQRGPQPLPTDKLPERKTCSSCPYQRKRKTAYMCVMCKKAVCLDFECSRKLCVNCTRDMCK